MRCEWVPDQVAVTQQEHQEAQDRLHDSPDDEQLQRDCLEANRRRLEAERLPPESDQIRHP